MKSCSALAEKPEAAGDWSLGLRVLELWEM